jgi:hypothetical protein
LLLQFSLSQCGGHTYNLINMDFIKWSIDVISRICRVHHLIHSTHPWCNIYTIVAQKFIWKIKLERFFYESNNRQTFEHYSATNITKCVKFINLFLWHTKPCFYTGSKGWEETPRLPRETLLRDRTIEM